MKLNRAIEILELAKYDPDAIDINDLFAAEDLGIEALKRTSTRRETLSWKLEPLLPGETPETTPTRSLHHIKAVLESPLGREPGA